MSHPKPIVLTTYRRGRCEKVAAVTFLDGAFEAEVEEGEALAEFDRVIIHDPDDKSAERVCLDHAPYAEIDHFKLEVTPSRVTLEVAVENGLLGRNDSQPGKRVAKLTIKFGVHENRVRIDEFKARVIGSDFHIKVDGGKSFYPSEFDKANGDADILSGIESVGSVEKELGFTDHANGSDQSLPFSIGFEPADETARLRLGLSFPVGRSRRNAQPDWLRDDRVDYPVPTSPQLPLMQCQPSNWDWENFRTAPTDGGQPIRWLLELRMPARTGVRLWTDAVAEEYTRSLRTVQAGRPVSICPRFSVDDVGSKAFAWLFLAEARFDPATAVPKLVFTGIDAIEKIEVRVAFDAFRLQFDQPLGFRAQIQPNPNLGGEGLEKGSRLRITAKLAETGGGSGAAVPTQVARLGALELTFASFPDSRAVATETILAATFERFDPTAKLQLQGVCLQGELPVARIAPGGQDDPPEEEFTPMGVSCFGSQSEDDIERNFRREVALVLPAPLTQGAGELGDVTPFFLSFQESTGQRQSQTLRLALRRGEATEGNVSQVVVVDRQPFFVGKVQTPDFSAGDPDVTELGNWSNASGDGAAWELSGTAESFKLTLPPQGVGEAMEKLKGTVDIEEDKPADFRFTPPTEITLRASDFVQRFAEAPWNLRRILGYPGQRTPGARLLAARFEMFYGLEGTILAEHLRLAEIGALVGAVPGRLPLSPPWKASAIQDKAYQAFRKRWSEDFRRYLSRLAVEQVWDSQQTNALLLTDEVGFELRRKARLKYPIPGKEDQREDRVPPLESLPNDDCLAGGVGWGFESVNIYNELWREPKSVAAELANPYFSALGGWGRQKASFAKGKTTIYAHVAMGRSYFISIERIGRISCLWNRAKHVIIYERTTLRSDQFGGPDDGDSDFEARQDRHRGRTILRKVREFVEILEPERKYPEFGAAPVTRAFLCGCECKSTIIPVDSAWGRDVGARGWEVPLWQSDLAEDDPVYPKPTVLVQCKADPDSGADETARAVRDPYKLRFYTSTLDDDGPDTDRWASVVTVDYADQPTPAVPLEPQPGDYDDTSLPPTVPAGQGRFTLSLETASRGIDMVAERSDKSIVADLANITVSRSRIAANPPAKPEESFEAIHLVERLSDAARNVVEELRSVSEVPADLLARLEARTRSLGDDIATLEGKLGSSIDQAKQAACLAARERVGRMFDAADGAIAAAFQAWREQVQKALEPVIRNNWEQGKETVKQELEAEFNRLVDELFSRDPLQRLTSLLTESEKQAKDLFTDLTEAAAELDGKLREAVVEVKTWGDAVKQTEIDALRVRMRAMRTEVRTRVLQIDRALARKQKGWLGEKADALRAEFRRIEPAVLGGMDAVDGLLVEGQDIRQKVVDGLEALQAGIAALEAEIPAKVVQRIDAIQAEIARLKIPDLKAPLYAFRNKLIKGIDDFSTVDTYVAFMVDTVEQALSDADGAVAGARSRIRELRSIAVQQVGVWCDQLIPDGRDVLAALKEQLQLAEVQDAINELGGNVGQLRSKLGEIGADLERRLGDGLKILEPVAQRGDDLFRAADSGLRAIRALGKPPQVPNLGFNRETVAYILDERYQEAYLTPAKSLVGAVDNGLKALGLDVPTNRLLDRVMPDRLERFDLSSIFPDFAGLKLDNLFKSLKMPAWANDNVVIRHGVDKQTLTAWLEARVDVALAGSSAEVFAIGPVKLSLIQARFQATSRVETSVGGSPRQTSSGAITGDWDVQIGGLALVVFRDATLSFDERSRIRFDIEPSRVELQGGMQFLADLLAQVNYSGGGFSIEFTPTGVTSSLDLQLPNIQLGTFGISDLSLGVRFGLLFSLASADSFKLFLRLFLGQKEAPFNLTVFILGGGGYLDFQTTYTPSTGAVRTDLSIGLTASASLALSLGPISGGVAVYFGITVEYHAASGSGGALAIGVLIIFRGHVSLLSIVSASIALMLEAQYHSDGRLVGRGRLVVKIKISFFFTLEIDESVEYQFGGSGGGDKSVSAPPFAAEALAAVDDCGGDPYCTAAKAYLQMFQEA